MTVATTSSSVTYQGNSSTALWTFPFIYVAAGDITVHFTASDGTVSLLDPSVYTLTLNAVSPGNLWGIGGSVLYPKTGPAIIAGQYLTVTRTIPFTQSVSISNQGAFYPQVVEQALDLLCLLIQQTQTQATFALQCPLEDQSAPTVLPVAALRANKTLKFDNAGQPIVA